MLKILACVYTEEVNKISLSRNDDKRSQTFGRTRIYPYRKNAFKCKVHNSMWPYIPDHSYRILIIGVSGSGKKKSIIKFNK